MKKLLLSAAIAAAMSPALAQYTGPGAQPVLTTLAAVLEKPVDDQRVVLKGKLLRQVSNDKYIFSDGKQEIRVDVDRKLFPAQPIAATTLVEITGEVEKEFMESPEIDVDTLRVVE